MSHQRPAATAAYALACVKPEITHLNGRTLAKKKGTSMQFFVDNCDPKTASQTRQDIAEGNLTPLENTADPHSSWCAMPPLGEERKFAQETLQMAARVLVMAAEESEV